ncbi:HNH endonuclease signature motif containing protein [Branchiibius hedensis]|nr:HNH endonuclease signature motif containing protein [Branchiibius hedensis]
MTLTTTTPTPVTCSPVGADASVAELLRAAAGLLQAAYARVSGDHAGLSEEDLMGDIVAAQHVQNSAWAIQSHRLTQAAAIEHRDDPNPIEGAYPLLIHRVIRHDPGSFVDEWFALETGTRLGWSDRHSNTRLGEALDTVERCPRLVDRVGSGTLDPGKACAVAQVSTEAPDHVARQIEDKILAGDPEGMTAVRLRAKARRLRARLDPVGADRAAQARRRSQVGVWVSPHHEPGLSQLTAVLPTLEAAKVMAAVDDLARELHQVTTTNKTLPQCRVDALTDLVLTGVGVDTQLTFTIPVTPPATPATAEDAGVQGLSFEEPDWDDLVDGFDEASLDYDWHEPGLTPINGLDQLDEELRALIAEELEDLNRADLNAEAHARSEAIGQGPPDTGPPDTTPPDTTPPQTGPPDEVPMMSPPAGHARHVAGIGDVFLPRVGIIPAAVITELTQLLGVKLTRALTDATTGTVIETADRSYRPGVRLARFVKTRDQHCRFPGCTRPATLSDIDHVTRYPDGDTAAHNLQCLCRHHHRAKHEGGWHVTMTSQGICTWTSPAGHTYVTDPGD